ncbi:DUF255 domain-containing protein [Bacteroidales bacterium AH-315-I05]|nr:DUF255 domain-containing protein [Bacteroidales bacterium AH-315-I05]
MKHLLSFLLVFLGLSAFSQNAEVKTISWMSWQEAVKAREQHIKENQEAIAAKKMFPKKLFIDIYTGWCGWCKRMDVTTFKDPTIVDYLNKNYFPVKMNAEMSDTIDYNNHTFINPRPGVKRSTHTLPASLLDSRLSYPSYVIMDENINRSVIFPGYKQPEDLLGILIFFKTNQHLSYKSYLEKQQNQNQNVNKP